MEVIHVVNGITPIYMGSTFYAIIRLYRLGDHPHIHGEHSGAVALTRTV